MTVVLWQDTQVTVIEMASDRAWFIVLQFGQWPLQHPTARPLGSSYDDFIDDSLITGVGRCATSS